MPLAVCATPIGNLEDVTLRVLAELAAADVVLCEDTRRTRILLGRHGIEARLLSCHEHNEASRTAQLLPRLVAGERVALVSDAGLPGVNDPGARIVTAALEAGVPVTVLPGPSAVETALVVSGLVGAQYRFVGYLPRRASELAELWRGLAGWSHPVVAFESAKRLGSALASLAAVDPDRAVVVCRELTKVYEEVVRGSAAELAERYREAPKGEITLVIGPASGTGKPDGDVAREAVAELISAGTPRRAAVAVVARLTGSSRNELYRRSL
jgi:16S rRNA (cytidine1402-2'-O)-methyltransferase